MYKENGYADREDYLQSLSEDTGVPLDVVQTIADFLGPSEDFDGLVTTLDDWEGEL